MPEIVNVLLVAEPNAATIERVQSVDHSRLRVHALSARSLITGDEELWPPRRRSTTPVGGAETDTDRLAREAHVILLGLPYPTRLYAKTRDLLWVHHPNAGASNLWASDFWGAPVTVTTSRGVNAALPIAETAIAGALMFARGLHLGARGALSRREYAGNLTVAGKTMGVVGLGGIGQHVARLARGLGMKVVATRRSAGERRADVEGVDEILPPGDLHQLLGQSDFVAICVMLTEETLGLFDDAAFAAMKPGAVLVNVARGEVVDEAALRAALGSGRLGGAYLDVYAGELSGSPPPADLLEDPRVVFTPHVSGAADAPGPRGLDLFVENLQRFLRGEPLRNVVDWERGY